MTQFSSTSDAVSGIRTFFKNNSNAIGQKLTYTLAESNTQYTAEIVSNMTFPRDKPTALKLGIVEGSQAQFLQMKAFAKLVYSSDSPISSLFAGCIKTQSGGMITGCSEQFVPPGQSLNISCDIFGEEDDDTGNFSSSFRVVSSAQYAPPRGSNSNSNSTPAYSTSSRNVSVAGTSSSHISGHYVGGNVIAAGFYFPKINTSAPSQNVVKGESDVNVTHTGEITLIDSKVLTLTLYIPEQNPLCNIALNNSVIDELIIEDTAETIEKAKKGKMMSVGYPPSFNWPMGIQGKVPDEALGRIGGKPHYKVDGNFLPGIKVLITGTGEIKKITFKNCSLAVPLSIPSTIKSNL